MAGESRYRLYDDLARWWPLISPPEEYEEEAAFAAEILKSARRPVREVLELGSGGGHNAFHLKSHFEMTLVDLAPAMLEMSERLNPECRHHRDDMRTVRLERTFDAVFIHDAIDYLLSEEDLEQTMRTVWLHCRPGGACVLVPDQTRESFAPGSEEGGSDGPQTAVRYLEWSWDPDPADTRARATYAVLIRDGAGRVECVHETHDVGLFPRATWVRVLESVGFEVEVVPEATSEDRPARDFFVGIRPEAAGDVGDVDSGVSGGQ